MRLGILGFATVCALGMSSAGFAANRTYFLNVPRIDTLGTIGIEGFKTESFQAFGTITTDGVSAPGTGDVVDYAITMYSYATATGYTLTPGNSNFSWLDVPATLFGLFSRPGTEVAALSNQACNTSETNYPCYGLDIFTQGVGPPPWVHGQYDVLGFGRLGPTFDPINLLSWDPAPVPQPWAVAALELVGPDTLWTALRFYGLAAAPAGNLLSTIEEAERFHVVNDIAGTCRALNAVVEQVREGERAGDVNADSDAADSARVVAYVGAIEVQAGCNW